MAAVAVGGTLLIVSGITWVGLHPRAEERRAGPAPLASPEPDVRLAPTEMTVRAIDDGAGITTYRLPARSAPRDVAVAHDGSVWVSEQSGATIAHLAPSNGAAALTSYGPFESGSGPFSVGLDDGGIVWATDYSLGRVLRLDPATSILTRIPLPVQGSATLGLALTPDQLWFTDPVGGYLGRVRFPLEPGPASVLTLPVSSAAPYRAVPAPDGGMWFTDPGTDSVWRVDAQGTPTRYELPKGSDPYDITISPDGAVWYTLQKAGAVGSIDIGGTLHRIRLPGSVAPGSIAIDATGHLWVADIDRNVLYEVDVRTEHVSTVTLPSDASAPDGLAFATDGTLWLTAVDGDMVLHLDPARV